MPGFYFQLIEDDVVATDDKGLEIEELEAAELEVARAFDLCRTATSKVRRASTYFVVCLGPCDGLRRPGVDVSPRCDERLNAVEAAMLDGHMNGSLIALKQLLAESWATLAEKAEGSAMAIRGDCVLAKHGQRADTLAIAEGRKGSPLHKAGCQLAGDDR